MIHKTFKYDFKDLNIDVVQIESVMGYKQGESQEMISELISEILKESETISNIKAEFAIFDNVRFNDPEKSVEINSLVFNLKKIVYGQIKKSESIAVFLGTAGEEIGIRSRKAMKEGDLLRGYVYDVIGSEIVEASVDRMQDGLGKEMLSSERRITNRYSPGYCGWDVIEQHKLFRLIPDNFCGISLNDSALMTPVKSVSGFIGIGRNVKYNPYTCNLCSLQDCIHRKVRARNPC